MDITIDVNFGSWFLLAIMQYVSSVSSSHVLADDRVC